MKRKGKQKRKAQANQPFMLSACAIVKNEEKNLPQWLACMKELADEMVVVDTGSTDGTVALAEAAGARVFHFPWIGDFAAAKNYAIEQARGNWIAFLDADEYIAASDRGKARAAIERAHRSADLAGLMCSVVNIDRDRSNMYTVSYWQIRIFRNLPGIRYHGRIHETLKNSARTGASRIAKEDAFCIYHTGYSSSVIEQKVRRDLELLLKVQAEQGEQPQNYHYIADCYFGLKDYGKALDYAQRAIAAAGSAGRSNRPHAIRMESLIHLERGEEELLAAFREAQEAFPGRAEYQAILGNYYWNRKDYLKAQPYFEAALAVLDEPKESASIFLTDESANVESFASCRLGILAKWRGRGEVAMEYLLRGLRRNKYYAPSLLQLLSLLSGAPAEDVLQVLNAIYDRQADAAFLVPRLRQAGREREALYYDARYEEQNGRPLLTETERYFLAGNIPAAGSAAAEDMDSLAALGAAIKGQMNLPAGTLDALLSRDARRALNQEDWPPEARRLRQRIGRVRSWLETK